MGLSLSLGLSLTSATLNKGAGVSYEPEATALFARFTTPPDDTRKGLINDLIKAFKNCGAWVKWDGVWVMAAADSQAARQNWIADQYNLSAVSGPTFTIDRGYGGDGSASYLNMNLNPSTAVSPKFVLNSASLMVYQRVTSGGSIRAIMGNTNASISLPGTGTTIASKVNDAGTGTTDLGANKTGLFAASRANSAGYERYRNGSSVASITQVSTSLTNAAMRILSDGSGFSSGQAAFAAVGSDLTASEQLAVFNALNTYLQAIGAA